MKTIEQKRLEMKTVFENWESKKSFTYENKYCVSKYHSPLNSDEICARFKIIIENPTFKGRGFFIEKKSKLFHSLSLSNNNSEIDDAKRLESFLNVFENECYSIAITKLERITENDVDIINSFF